MFRDYRPHKRSIFFTNIKKLLIVSSLLSIAGLVILFRLFEISTDRSKNLNKVKNINKNEQIIRGKIRDRNGKVLASNIYTYNLLAHPNRIDDINKTLIMIKQQLPEFNLTKLEKKINNKKKVEVLLKKSITAPEAKRINSLGIPGLSFKKRLKRFYPHKNLTSHIVGHLNDNTSGVYGAEKTFDSNLIKGEDVYLSIDLRLQHAVREELFRGLVKYEAKSASAILVDLNSSEILSLVSLPDFNPNKSINPNSKSYRNTATLNLYEMGSTFKIFTLAAALELSDIQLTTNFDASSPLKISNFTIKDYHPENRVLTAKEVFLKSSNIGSSLMAQEIGYINLKSFYNKIGILDFSKVNLFEKSRPILPRKWGDIEIATLSFGHGISITPMNMIEAVSLIFKKNNANSLTIKRKIKLVSTENNILSEINRTKLINLMEDNVLYGTGKKAAVKGYKIGGKTATGEKINRKGHYDKDKLVSSFISIFPVNKPRYIALVLFDEPFSGKKLKTKNNATGGATAAPITGNIIKRIAPILGITNDNKDNIELIVKKKEKLNFVTY